MKAKRKNKKASSFSLGKNHFEEIISFCFFLCIIIALILYTTSSNDETSVQNPSRDVAIEPSYKRNPNQVEQTFMNDAPFAQISFSNTILPLTERSNPRISDKDCKWKNYHLDLILGHIEGKGVGFNTGYTKTELLLYVDKPPDSFKPFIDLRGAFFNNGSYDLGAGIGVRYRAPSFCRDFGFNLYYDYLNLHHTHFNQIGIGFDTHGRYWDLRINGYIPFGERHHLHHVRTRHYSGGFFSKQHQFINVMTGGDAEIGIPIRIHKNFRMYSGFQGYYYGSSENHAGGIAFRVDILFNKYVSCEFKISHDNYFHTRALVGIFFNIPLYSQKSKSYCSTRNCEDLENRGWQNVYRSDTIVTDRSSCWFWNW